MTLVPLVLWALGQRPASSSTITLDIFRFRPRPCAARASKRAVSFIQLREEARKHCDVDLLHSDVEAVIEWLKMRVLDEYKAERIRDALIEIYSK
jgi:hypothetical protein